MDRFLAALPLWHYASFPAFDRWMARYRGHVSRPPPGALYDILQNGAAIYIYLESDRLTLWQADGPSYQIPIDDLDSAPDPPET